MSTDMAMDMSDALSILMRSISMESTIPIPMDIACSYIFSYKSALFLGVNFFESFISETGKEEGSITAAETTVEWGQVRS